MRFLGDEVEKFWSSGTSRICQNVDRVTIFDYILRSYIRGHIVHKMKNRIEEAWDYHAYVRCIR